MSFVCTVAHSMNLLPDLLPPMQQRQELGQKRPNSTFLSRAILTVFFVHLAARQEFNLCQPLSADGGRAGRAPSQGLRSQTIHGGGDATAPSLALVVPDTARSWDLLSSSQKMGKKEREGRAAP